MAEISRRIRDMEESEIARDYFTTERELAALDAPLLELEEVLCGFLFLLWNPRIIFLRAALLGSFMF